VDQTPKGWFISYINRDPDVIARREQIEKKEKMARADEDIAQKSIDHQVKMAKLAAEESGGLQRSEATDLQRDEGDESKVALAMSSKKVDVKVKPMGMSFSSAGPSTTKKVEKRKMSAMEEMMYKNEQAKEKKARKDYWLSEGIIVKVMNKGIADGQYYKRKGVVRKVVDTYTGVVKMMDDGVKIKIDQDQLETVIPNPGGKVQVVNGAYRGSLGVVKAIDVDSFTVSVEISAGTYCGDTVKIDYEDACKVQAEED